jgi:hypothetical protein
MARSQSRGKNYEWDSTGSMYQAQPSQSCASTDKAKNYLMLEDPTSPTIAGVAPEKPRFEETEEVNSPKKRLLPRNKDQNLGEPVVPSTEDEEGAFAHLRYQMKSFICFQLQLPRMQGCNVGSVMVVGGL